MTKQLEKLGNQAGELLRQKTDLEIQLQAINDQLKKLQEIDIPEELLCMGVNKATLDCGITVAVKKEFYGGISYEKSDRAVALLESHGYIFPWGVNIKVSKDDSKALCDLMTEYGYEAKAKPDIHASTYKKLCKDLEAQGLLDEQTQDILGVVVKITATVKQAE